MTTRSITFALLILASIALFATSVYRATSYPFTHDECLSYFSFTSDPGWRSTANNHILNTYSMQVTHALFGNSELSLRLPNILAHALYLTSVLLILKRLQLVVAVLGFSLLNLNPFALDFFFLARGYGLAMAFQLLSLFFIIKTYEAKREQRGYLKFAYLSGTFGVVAMFGNYAFVIHYIPLVIANVWILLGDTRLIRIDRTKLLSTTIFVVMSVACVAFVYWKSSQLQKDNQLYFGGSTGFTTDTLVSLVNCSCYAMPYSSDLHNAIAMTVIGIFLTLLAVNVAMIVRHREMSLGMICVAMLAIAIVLPIVAHQVFGSLYPIERGALYYLPLFAVALMFTLDGCVRHWESMLARSLVLVFPICLSLILAWHFVRSFDANNCYTWAYDKHNKEILNDFDKGAWNGWLRLKVRLIHFKSMGPSFEYYKRTRGYDWLELISVLPPDPSEWLVHQRTDFFETAHSDCIYGFKSDLKDIPADLVYLIKSFEKPDTVLLGIVHGRHIEHSP